jgi:small subunit ribosomal protein S1
MVSKSTSQEIAGGPPPLDESWWAALLAEEEEKVSGISYANNSFPSEKRESHTLTVDWVKAEEIYQEDETVEMHVTGFNRGGLLVEGEQLQGFVPISHLVDLPVEKSEDNSERLLAEYVGSDLLLKVIECDSNRGRVVFSERAAKAEPGSRNRLLESLNRQDRIWGTVTNITDFGVFVDLGGLEGLIHVSEISWGRVRHPSDILEIGSRIEVFVISVDEERSRVALSLKRLQPNPWETAELRYQPGQITEATITSIMSFGAFARLEEGLDGLIHVSEMCPSSEVVNPRDVVREGQKIRVRILQVDSARQRMGLSLNIEPQS